MHSRATIVHAKVSGSDYGRESTLTLTLDVKLPTPVEVRTINEWAASELDWDTRQQIAAAQRKRRNKRAPEKLTKAQKKAQAQSHEQGTECGFDSCSACQSDEGESDDLLCLEHEQPWQECTSCEEGSAILLEREDTERLRERYQRYVREQAEANQEALQAAHEAALFLLLIKKPVQLSIAPAQQAFAEFLRLAAPQP